MTRDHKFQPQRFELKYVINFEQAALIRDFVSAYLELDEYSLTQPGFAYTIHSVYLDSDDLDTHRATVNGTKNRFKLRLRYYDDRPDTPVFCEVKSRVDNCISKRRCGLQRTAVPFLLAGQLPEREWLVAPELRHWLALERFICLSRQLQARPRLHNCYRREAWTSPHGNSVRVTFDRDIQAGPWFSFRLPGEMIRPTRLLPQAVVLELKFTARFPDWFRQLVQRFNLMQTSCAKYSDSVTLIGEHRFRRAFSEWPPSGATNRVLAGAPHAAGITGRK